MRKISIYVSERELLALEDILVAWSLCKKHKIETINKSDPEIYKIQYNCKNCQKLRKRWWSGAWSISSKLFGAYERSRKNSTVS
jgi:hypothetical protein